MWMLRIGWVIGCIGMSAFAQAFDNIEIAKKDVPPAALQTAKYYAPGVAFTRYAYEDEDGIRIYEFEGNGIDGKHIEVDVLANGDLQEIEIEIDESEIPVSISMEMDLQHEGLIVDFAEMSVRPDGTIVYEIEGHDIEHEFVDLEITDNGRRLKTSKYAAFVQSKP